MQAQTFSTWVNQPRRFNVQSYVLQPDDISDDGDLLTIISLLTTIYESMLNQKPQSHSRDYRCDCDKLNTSTTSRESDWIHLIFRKAYLIQTKGTNLSGFLESQPDSCISWTC